MRTRRQIVFSTVILLAAAAFAYNPPTDTAGPLTVRIVEPTIGSYGAGGPVVLNRTGVPFTLTVSLENSSADARIAGTLRVTVIDRWRVEPAAAVPFSVDPRGRARVQFTVTVGGGTYNAHYPIHAFAEFEHAGKRHVARPVLILSTRLPNPPRAVVPIEWKPVPVPAHGEIELWRLPVRRDSARVSRQDPLAGGEVFESTPTVQINGDSIRMTLGPRPPSLLERADAATVEYPLALPQRAPVRLMFSNSGGAAFLVRVDGEAIWERRGQGDADIDLSRFAGRSVRLQLEAEGDGTAVWREPVIRTAELPPATLAGREVGGGIRFTPGLHGILDGTLDFNGIALRGFRVQVLGDTLDARSASTLLEVRDEGSNRIRHRFRSWAGNFDLVSDLAFDRGALRVSFRLEDEPEPKPWLHAYIESVSAGPWSRSIERVYAGTGNVIQRPTAPFQTGFDGHRLATSFIGIEFAGGGAIVQGVDVPPDRMDVNPAERMCTLVTPHAQTLIFIPAANAWEAAKIWREVNGRRASAGVKNLAGRFVFDLWGLSKYRGAALALEQAFKYGLTDSAVVWHNWQRWGYDYRLPDIWPPNPQGGSAGDFANLARICRDHGVLFAPHDNYIDFYPDSESFSYDNIAFNRDGTPRRAWYNSGRQAQSYRVRADRLRPFLERNVKLIKEGIAPNAYFIDVWSSMGPYDYWTLDGRFVPRTVTRQVWGESFAWIRDLFGGAPQISEAGHDQLIGWLDGAQANHLRVDAKADGFVWRAECEDAERVPWFDFAYHDIFALHGAGYQDRYAAGLDLRTHGMYSDDYIATEVLTGHPAMVHIPFGRDVVRKYWLLHDLMRALAERRIETVEFAGGNLHRQRVAWEDGIEVLVNRGAEPWTAGGRTLPQYGFRAAGADIEAGIDANAEWSASSEAVYVNPRGAAPAEVRGVTANGGVRLTRDGGSVRVMPLPSSGAVTVRIDWAALPWKAPAPSVAEALDDSGAVLSRAKLRTEAGRIILECAPGAFAYRLASEAR